MPVIIPPAYEALYERLSLSGATVLHEQDALRQDVRPARIGLLNLMPAPAMESTENQWMRYISNTVLHVEPVLLKFDNDLRERPGGSRTHILKRYTRFSDAAEDGLDGLIVTGDNIELQKDGSGKELPFEDVTYGESLRTVIDWARTNVYSTIYSCFGAHFALNYLHDAQRRIAQQKVFGVFRHDIEKFTRNPILSGLDDVFYSPHSRWGNIESKDLRNKGVQVLLDSPEVGWLLASEENEAGGLDIYLQGHPEYDKYDLHSEFIRDWENGQEMPDHYYDKDNPAAMPKMTWANDGRALHSNWMSAMFRHFSQ